MQMFVDTDAFPNVIQVFAHVLPVNLFSYPLNDIIVTVSKPSARTAGTFLVTFGMILAGK